MLARDNEIYQTNSYDLIYYGFKGQNKFCIVVTAQPNKQL